MTKQKRIKARFATLGQKLLKEDRLRAKRLRAKQRKSTALVVLVTLVIGITLGYAWRMDHDRKLVERTNRVLMQAQEIVSAHSRARLPMEIIDSVRGSKTN